MQCLCYKLAIQLLSVLLLVSMAKTAIAASLVAEINYTEIHERVLPFPELTYTDVRDTVQFETDGRISSLQRRLSGSASGKNERLSTLGKSDNLQLWKVSGGNKFSNYTAYISYTRIVMIEFSGNDCKMDIKYVLKDGASDYRYRRLRNNEEAVARSVSAERLSCQLSLH